MRTIEATIDTNGQLHTSESLIFEKEQPVLVTFLDVTDSDSFEVTLLSQTSLEDDWGRSEEDRAWRHLQPEK
jgi:hypothetical protein